MRRIVGRENLLWTQWKTVATRFPGKIVLIDAVNNEVWTAESLTDAAHRFSERLRPYEAGQKIAFRLPNGSEWMALFLALQREGIAAVPLDGGMPADGCREAAHRRGCLALYLDGEFHPVGKTRDKEPRSISEVAVDLRATDPRLEIAGYPPKPEQASGNSTLKLKNSRCCCIKVTSGTGALPKAIECRAEHLLADGRQIIATMKIRPGDVNLAAIPLGHSYGLGNLVMPLILQGTAMVCAGEYVPRQLVEWIERYRVTVFPCVPALFRILAALPAGPEIGSLRTAISAGAVLTPAVAQAFFARYGIKIHNFYGSSETGGICYDRTGSASLTGRSLGKPLEGVSVLVKKNRIVVASPAVAMRGGRWRLGDFGEWNKRGELVLLGRAGQRANIDGKKVHPLEVERVLRALPRVTDAAVWLGQSGGRDLLAAAVETALARGDIERALAARLPAWKLPKAYVIARELPRTARGKLDLAALRRLGEEG